MKLEKILLNAFLISNLLFTNVSAQTKFRDNFPLELRKYQYEARLAKKAGKERPEKFKKENLEEDISGYINIDIKKQENNYIIDVDSYPAKSIANLFGGFKMHIQTRLSCQEKNKSQHYKVLESISKNNYRILFVFINETKKSEYLKTDSEQEIELKINKRKFFVPSDTQDILTSMINLFAEDYSKSGKYHIGKLKGDDKTPTDIYVDITKNNDDYIAEMTLPEETLLSNKTPLKTYYRKKNGKVKISRLEIFIKKFTINNWVVATPIKN